jgi:hypothetical protein
MSITTHARFDKAGSVKHILPGLEVSFMENGYNSNRDAKKGGQDMTQELDNRIRTLRAELTRMVREGNDEDGMLLRRMLAELERLENQRLALRIYNRHESQGGAHAGLAV